MNKETKEKITQLRSEGLGYKKIAKELDLNLSSVKSFCRSNKAKNRKLGITNCKYCKSLLNQSERKNITKFCSSKCRMNWWNQNREKINKKNAIDVICRHCSKKFRVYKNENRKYCSYHCYIEDRFKGESNGYSKN